MLCAAITLADTMTKRCDRSLPTVALNYRTSGKSRDVLKRIVGEVYHLMAALSEEEQAVELFRFGRMSIGRLGGYLAMFAVGLLLAQVSGVGWASRTPPTKHKGVTVESLGVVEEKSLSRQLGIDGHIMQLREITLEPGGAIARHSHGARPGLVWTVSGSWVEGRANGEMQYPAGKGKGSTIVEDADTDHWFFNDGAVPAKVLVCDIVPAPQ